MPHPELLILFIAAAFVWMVAMTLTELAWLALAALPTASQLVATVVVGAVLQAGGRWAGDLRGVRAAAARARRRRPRARAAAGCRARLPRVGGGDERAELRPRAGARRVRHAAARVVPAGRALLRRLRDAVALWRQRARRRLGCSSSTSCSRCSAGRRRSRGARRAHLAALVVLHALASGCTLLNSSAVVERAAAPSDLPCLAASSPPRPPSPPRSVGGAYVSASFPLSTKFSLYQRAGGGAVVGRGPGSARQLLQPRDRLLVSRALRRAPPRRGRRRPAASLAPPPHLRLALGELRRRVDGSLGAHRAESSLSRRRPTRASVASAEPSSCGERLPAPSAEHGPCRRRCTPPSLGARAPQTASRCCSPSPMCAAPPPAPSAAHAERPRRQTAPVDRVAARVGAHCSGAAIARGRRRRAAGRRFQLPSQPRRAA